MPALPATPTPPPLPPMLPAASPAASQAAQHVSRAAQGFAGTILTSPQGAQGSSLSGKTLLGQ